MSGGTAGVRGTGAECRKFAPNIFNKSKCSSCFKQKEEHSAEALECNRVSFAWWTLYLFPFLSLSSSLRASVYLARSRTRCLSLSVYPALSSVYSLFLTYGCVCVSVSLHLTRAYTVRREPAFSLSCSPSNSMPWSGPGRRTKVLTVRTSMLRKMSVHGERD